jgi:cysteinyl-tRNA synthetase
MASEHLDGQIDIHGGGADLIFPHHENEIAQSEAYLGREPFARYWVHNGLLRLGEEKMSKSLGNMVRVAELLKRGMAGPFRLMVLQSRYRAPLTYTEEGLEAAARGLDRLRAAAEPLTTTPRADQAAGEDLDRLSAATRDRFIAAMDNDFDSPGAIASLFDLGRAINRARAVGQGGVAVETARATLVELAGVLGLDLTEAPPETSGDTRPLIDLLVEVRDRLRADRQWALSDLIRDRLAEQGVAIEDGAAGSTWTRRGE